MSQDSTSLNRATAEHLMGWTQIDWIPRPKMLVGYRAELSEKDKKYLCKTPIGDYVNNANLAMQVAKKCRITIHPTGKGWMAAQCNWSQSGEVTAVGVTNHQKWREDESLGRAVCLTALSEAGHNIEGL